MVAIIKTGHSIVRILNYNEHKVKDGVAECIGAGNYPLDPERMTFSMKLNYFKKQLELNENVKRNSVHISLNFPQEESRLSTERLMNIAEKYMEKIGFGKQPYLVYKHHDAGHPHIHIVSIKVMGDGRRIDMHNIGRDASEKARKAIEKEFKLVPAESKNRVHIRQQTDHKNDNQRQSALRVSYGKTETRKAIQQVLDVVINQYKYTSLPELNAVLKGYNVMAEQGNITSRLYLKNGLQYRVLDKDGKPIGVPIKASLFREKPILANLEKRYKVNEQQRITHKSRVKNAIDLLLLKDQPSLKIVIEALQKQGIATILRTNEAGQLFGITYVDHQTKCVFNGSDLGKKYSAKGIHEACRIESLKAVKESSKWEKTVNEKFIEPKPKTNQVAISDKDINKENQPENNFFDILNQPQLNDYLPYQWRRKKKKSTPKYKL